jgi:hypothetical protein
MNRITVATSTLIKSVLEADPNAGKLDDTTIMGYGDVFPENVADGYVWSLTSLPNNPIYAWSEDNQTWFQIGCDSTAVETDITVNHSVNVLVRSAEDGSEIKDASVYVIGPHFLVKHGSFRSTSEHGIANFFLSPSISLNGDEINDGGIEFNLVVAKGEYISYVGSFSSNPSDMTLITVDLEWVYNTPSIITMSWTDESDDHYSTNFKEYKADKIEFEKYAYRYAVIQPEPVGSNSSSDVAKRSIINPADDLPDNFHYKFMHHRFDESGSYAFNDFLHWDDTDGVVSAGVIDDFDINNSYFQHDLIRFGGNYYKAVVDVPTVALTNTDLWQSLNTYEYDDGIECAIYDVCWLLSGTEEKTYYIARNAGLLPNPVEDENNENWIQIFPAEYENRNWLKNEIAISGEQCYSAIDNIECSEPGKSEVWKEYDVVYDHERDYQQYDVIIFQKIWYEAKSNIVSRSPNRGNVWEEVTVSQFQIGASNVEGSLVSFRSAVYCARTAVSDKYPYDYDFWYPVRVDNFDEIFDQTAPYLRGQFVIFFGDSANCLYRAKHDIEPGNPFNPSDWEEFAVTDGALEFESWKTYAKDAVVIAPKSGKSQYYKALKETTGFYPPTSTSDWVEIPNQLSGDIVLGTRTYNTRLSNVTNDLVSYDGKLYRATADSANNTPYNNLVQWKAVSTFSKSEDYQAGFNVVARNEASIKEASCFTSRLPVLGNVLDAGSQNFSIYWEQNVWSSGYWSSDYNYRDSDYIVVDDGSGYRAWKPKTPSIKGIPLTNQSVWRTELNPSVVLDRAYHLEEICSNGGNFYQCLEEGALGSSFADVSKFEPISPSLFSIDAEYTKGAIVVSAEGAVGICIDSESVYGVSPEDSASNTANEGELASAYNRKVWCYWTNQVPAEVDEYDPEKIYCRGDFISFLYEGSYRVYKCVSPCANLSHAPGMNGYWTTIKNYAYQDDYYENDVVYSNDWRVEGTFKANTDITSNYLNCSGAWTEDDFDASEWEIADVQDYVPGTSYLQGAEAYDRFHYNNSDYYVALRDIDNRFLNNSAYWEVLAGYQIYSADANYSVGSIVTNTRENVTWYRTPTVPIISVYPTVNTDLWELLGNLNFNYYYGSDYASGSLLSTSGKLYQAKVSIDNRAPQWQTTAYWRKVDNYDEKLSYLALAEDGLPNAVVKPEERDVGCYSPISNIVTNHRIASNSGKGVTDAFWKTEAIKRYKTFRSYNVGDEIFRRLNSNDEYWTYEATANMLPLSPNCLYEKTTPTLPPNGWDFIKVFYAYASYNKDEVVAIYNGTSEINRKVYRAKQNIPNVSPYNTDYWQKIYYYDLATSYATDSFVAIDQGYGNANIYRALQPSLGIHPTSGENQYQTYWQLQPQTSYDFTNRAAYPIYSVVKRYTEVWGTFQSFVWRLGDNPNPYIEDTWFAYAIQQVPAVHPLTASAEYWEEIDAPAWDPEADYVAGSYVTYAHNNSGTGELEGINDDFYGPENSSPSYNTFYPDTFVATTDIVSNFITYNEEDYTGSHATFWKKKRQVHKYDHKNDYALGDVVEDPYNLIEQTDQKHLGSYWFETALKEVISNNYYYNTGSYVGSHATFWNYTAAKTWSEIADYDAGDFTYGNGNPGLAKIDVISNHISYADGEYVGDHETFWTRLAPYAGHNYHNDYAQGDYVSVDYAVYRAKATVISNHWDYYTDSEGVVNPNYPDHQTFWQQRTVQVYKITSDYLAADVVSFDNNVGGIFGDRYAWEIDDAFYQANKLNFFKAKVDVISNAPGVMNGYWAVLPVLTYDTMYDYAVSDRVKTRAQWLNKDVLVKPRHGITSKHVYYNDRAIPIFDPNSGYYYSSCVVLRNTRSLPAMMEVEITLNNSYNLDGGTITFRLRAQVSRMIYFNFYSYGGYLYITAERDYEGTDPGMNCYGEGYEGWPYFEVIHNGVTTKITAPPDYYQYGFYTSNFSGQIASLNGYSYPQSAILISGPPNSAVRVQGHPMYDGDISYLKVNHEILWNESVGSAEFSCDNDYDPGDVITSSGSSYVCKKEIKSNSFNLRNDPARSKWEERKIYNYDFVGTNFDYDAIRNDKFIPAGYPVILNDNYQTVYVPKKRLISYSLDKTKYWMCYFIQGAFSMYKESFNKITRSFPDENKMIVGLYVDIGGSLTIGSVFRNSVINDSTIYVDQEFDYEVEPGKTYYDYLVESYPQITFAVDGSDVTATIAEKQYTVIPLSTIEGDIAGSDLLTFIDWIFSAHSNVEMVIPRTSADERWLEWTRSFIEDLRITVNGEI